MLGVDEGTVRNDLRNYAESAQELRTEDDDFDVIDDKYPDHSRTAYLLRARSIGGECSASERTARGPARLI
jgi:hypothetical protein